MQIFELEYVKPEDVVQLIKPFNTDKIGECIPVKNTNIVIVTDYASNLLKIAHLIGLIDTPKPTVVTLFVDVQHVDAAALGQKITAILTAANKAKGARGGDLGVSVASDERTNRLVLVGTEKAVGEVTGLAQSLDVPLGVTTEMYTLQYVAPERIDEIVKNLMDPIQAKRLYRSAVDAEGNALIVTSTPDVHREVKTLIRRMDVPSTQRQSPIRFYKLKNTTADSVLATLQAIQEANTQQTLPSTGMNMGRAPNLAPNDRVSGAIPMPLQPGESPPPFRVADQAPRSQRGNRALETVAAPASVSFAGAQITADSNTNMLIVVAEPSVQRMYAELIRSLDQRRPQVLIEAKVVAIDTSDNYELGVEISGGERLGDPFKFAFSSFGLNKVTSTGLMTLNPAIGFNGAVLDSQVADVIVKAVANHSRAKVLSAPRILVNDNVQGQLQSIKSVPYQSVNASQTVSTTSLGGNQDAGTTISVTPHISEDNHLQLEFSIEFSSFVGEGTATLPPARHVDNINSTVTIPDGSTVIVGGLNLRDRSNSVQGIPVLERIPVVKYATSLRKRGGTCTSFFVFIRPIVLRDDKFKDLKFLSGRSAVAARERGDFPTSQPILMR
jgi:general secretion pathway protein D